MSVNSAWLIWERPAFADRRIGQCSSLTREPGYDADPGLVVGPVVLLMCHEHGRGLLGDDIRVEKADDQATIYAGADAGAITERWGRRCVRGT
jgi:hypothetical protein